MSDDFFIRPFFRSDTDVVIALWDRCGLLSPENDPRRDITRKLKVRPDLFLVGETAGAVVATAMGGYDGHRGWLNYVGVDPRFQGCDYGRLILAEVERRLRLEGCPKINLLVRDGNERVMAFYEKLGYATGRASLMGKRLVED